MAVVCTKCSAEIPAGSQFCAACGTPVAAAPAYTPVQPVVMAPPAKSGGGAVKIILIVLAIFLGLGIIGAGAFGFMVWRISRSIHVSGANGEVSINTPGGHIEANGDKSYSADELGTDIYPGAQSVKGGMKMDLPSGSVVTGAFITGDSKDAVVNFYKAKFGSDAAVYDTSDGAMLTVKKGEQESVMVTITAKPGQDDGKTKFVIVHTKTSKAS